MNRIDKLREKLGSDFSAVLVEETTNRWYLTELRSSAGILIVTEDEALFIVDFRYIEVAEKTVVGAKVILQETELLQQIKAYLTSKGITKMLVEEEMTLARYVSFSKEIPEVEIVANAKLSKVIEELRSIKEEKELDAIKAAQRITERSFEHIVSYIKVGMTEREIATELDCSMLRNGSEGFAFSSIVVSGPNSSLPHGVPGDRKVQNGDFITMDFGAKKDGYCSDMTRTIAVGYASEEMKKVYDIVLEAHLAARRVAKAGMTGKELDKIARDIIYEAGYEGRFGHGLGHSLGLAIHENPRASYTFDDVLQENVIMTIEPGIYLPNQFGVRIENMVLLKKNGNENLTESPTELIIV